ncbi:ZNF783 isoform 4 [Pan troglodytes]|uniref:ZNF783 isoform 4 n=1 Tax=Pan troglodytes TaxID=9598 RepID=A0A2J8QUT3_PANTR|nr:ZNF783 isoform 4 [Pan troglodytes]
MEPQAAWLQSLEGCTWTAKKKLADCEKVAVEFGNQLETPESQSRKHVEIISSALCLQAGRRPGHHQARSGASGERRQGGNCSLPSVERGQSPGTGESLRVWAWASPPASGPWLIVEPTWCVAARSGWCLQSGCVRSASCMTETQASWNIPRRSVLDQARGRGKWEEPAGPTGDHCGTPVLRQHGAGRCRGSLMRETQIPLRREKTNTDTVHSGKGHCHVCSQRALSESDPKDGQCSKKKHICLRCANS